MEQQTAERPLTRREKIRLGKKQRAEAYANATPEERAKIDEKRRAERAYRASHRKVDTNSRAYRWAAAIGTARAAVDKLEEGKGDFENAMSELNDLKQEYQDWLDNLPESLQQSPVGEKLQAIVDIDFEVEIDIESASEAVDNAEGAELPLGFGRD